ncbi:hypothetical protein KC326_g18 [Hortaea werneckii]|nr:hypothetical protein KC326_g18 [Hortaea werneckii]
MPAGIRAPSDLTPLSSRNPDISWISISRQQQGADSLTSILLCCSRHAFCKTNTDAFYLGRLEDLGNGRRSANSRPFQVQKVYGKNTL